MFEFLTAPLAYQFFVTALLCGSAIALVAALVGTHLTLKGFSMLGDGLSHVGFGTVAVAAAVGAAPLAVAIPVVILAAFLLLRLASGGARADASVAMLSAAGLAVGVVAVSLSGTNFDLSSYLFGSVLAVSKTDAPVVLVVCGAVFVIYLLCYPAFFSLTFDEEFLEAQTAHRGFFRTTLSALSAVIVVVGMQSVGALLISALLIFAPSSAARLTRSFRQTVILSAVLGVVTFVVGLYLSFYLSLPAGASVVLVGAAVYLVFLALGALKKRR